MSFYENGSWSAGRQPSWDQPPNSARSAASPTSLRDDSSAFGSQFEEVDRAADNLMKGGKMFSAPGRRDSMPIMGGRPYSEYDPRMAMPQRHHSVSEYDGIRSQSASNLHNFYANQRHQSRPNDAEHMMQAKRRMAAQRERELRNYHQEQQYNRNVSGAKSDRSLSPNTMSEEERRELIARQHRALYGNDSNLYGDGSNIRQSSQDARVSAGMPNSHEQAQMAFDPFGSQAQKSSAEAGVQMPPRDRAPSKDASAGAAHQRSRANSTSSPSSNPNTSFSLFENAQQSSRTSTSSPGGSPPRQGSKTMHGPGVAPIGTRPAQGPGQSSGPTLNPGLSKRSTTPLPSPLSYGFSASDQSNNGGAQNERTTSAASNPPTAVTDKGVGLGWGSNSGVWGSSKNSLGVQASVWG